MGLYPPSSNETAFFEIAATLIPILLFGGVLVERSKPPVDGKWSYLHVQLGLSLPVFGSLALFAEVIAIRAIMAGDASTFDRIFVAAVLIAGMAAVVMAIFAPWLAGLQEKSDAAPRRNALLSLGVFGVIVGSAFVLLVQGINGADISEREEQGFRQALSSVGELEAVRARVESVSRELDRLEQRREVARARGDFVLYRSFSGQARSLSGLQRQYLREEKRLMLESWNLLLEGAGESPLRRLPFEGAGNRKSHRG